jgi:hypothetical protein
MALNPYFTSNTITQGSVGERDLLEDCIIESIQINGQLMHYIPRSYVAKDEILGEDRLSEFNTYVPIEMYFENVEGFGGNGAFIQKFGYMLEQTATLVVSKKRWETIIGDRSLTILPGRPAEGDLLYFPLAKSLFEIKFVQHQDPFYPVGKQYVYKLKVELYQYSSEKLDTGNSDIDIFEDLKSHDVTINENPDVPESFGDNTKFIEQGSDIVWNSDNPFGEVN